MGSSFYPIEIVQDKALQSHSGPALGFWKLDGWRGNLILKKWWKVETTFDLDNKKGEIARPLSKTGPWFKSYVVGGHITGVAPLLGQASLLHIFHYKTTVKTNSIRFVEFVFISTMYCICILYSLAKKKKQTYITS